MPTQNPPPKKSVLIIDRSKDSRDVLKTVLQRHGLEIFEATELESGLAAMRRFRPRVVVMDTESLNEPSATIRQKLDRELAEPTLQLVILGNVAYTNRNQDHFISKPYHYGPLIRTIEQLVEQSPLPCPSAPEVP